MGMARLQEESKILRECMDIEVHKYTCLPKSTISPAHSYRQTQKPF
jgi:hypothetical protein